MSSRCVVLAYHRLALQPFEPDEGDFVVPPLLFADHVHALAASRRPVVSLADLQDGRYPDGSVALTFDDGCDSDARVAAPLLRARGLSAAFFVSPGLVGREGRASWDDLRGLAEDGFTIGSHGLDHTLLDDLAPAELERQLLVAKQAIEERLGRTAAALALPGGTGGERARRAARAAGYRLVLGSRPGVFRGDVDAVLPRVTLRRTHGLAGLRSAIERQPRFLLRQQARYALTLAGRFVLGTDGYASLRARRLAQRARRS